MRIIPIAVVLATITFMVDLEAIIATVDCINEYRDNDRETSLLDVTRSILELIVSFLLVVLAARYGTKVRFL